MSRSLGLVFALVLASGCKTKAVPVEVTAPAAAAPAPVEEPVVAVERLEGPVRESSALVLARVGGGLRAFVADEDDGAIVEVDPEVRTVIATTKLGTRPRDLIVLADGRLAVTLPDADAIAVLARGEKGTLKEIVRTKTPAEPLGLALDPKDATLFVSTGASHLLLAYDARGPASPKLTATLGREPRAVLVSSDGARAFVAHAVEDFISVVTLDGASVQTPGIGNHAACSGGAACASARIARNAQALVRAGEHGVVVLAAQSSPMPGPGGSKSVICPPTLKPNGKGGFVEAEPAAVKQGYGFGDGDNGPPVTADMPTFDETTGKKWSTGLPPSLGAGCLLPRAGVATPDGALLVACVGSARVMRLSPTKQEEWIGPYNFGAKGKPPVDNFANGIVPNLAGKVIAVAEGPTAIALDPGGHALVWSPFARALTKIRADLSTEKLMTVPRVDPKDEAWLRGRELFFSNTDKRISTDGRACASCHVDGGDDGLTWKTPQGPRRTRFLRGEAASGPYGWKGEHATLVDHIRVTMKNLGGTGLPDEAIADLGAYVSALPKRRTAAADAGPMIARGKELFASAECSHCHAEGGSDRKVHDVGTGGAFMTPTLASAGTRRELMHDGRFKDLDALIAGAPSMGRGASLSADDRRALTRYLETL